MSMGDSDHLSSGNPTSLGDAAWPKEYYFKGEIIYLLADIIEPFEVWYRDGLTRKDVYNGLVSRYYEDKNVYMIHPMTKESFTIGKGCIVETQKEAYNFLPKLDDYKRIGADKIQNREVEIWFSVSDDEESGSTVDATLYVYKTPEGEYVPVQKIEKSYIKASKGIFRHVIINFNEFNREVTDKDIKYHGDIQLSNCQEDGTPAEDNKLHDLGEHFHLETAFHGYKKHHNKIYGHQEHNVRKIHFKNNLNYIMEHNRKNVGYTLGATKFADQSEKEFNIKPCLTDYDKKTIHTNTKRLNVENLPDEWDLRSQGKVTQIRDQNACGSCWAFASAAILEAALAKSNGKLVNLSVQSLIDCAWKYGPTGCNGGTLPEAMDYVRQNGIPTEMEYGSYLMEDGNCHIQNMTNVYKVQETECSYPINVVEIKSAIYQFGGIATGVLVNKDMQLYTGGVFFNPECPENVNHAVSIVGYGVSNGETYWIVKNSWGPSWGQAGYMFYSSGEKNDCEVISSMVYTIV